jgi:hypothetical protein
MRRKGGRAHLLWQQMEHIWSAHEWSMLYELQWTHFRVR